MVISVLYLTESYRMYLRCPSPTRSFCVPTRLGLGYVLHREECEPESDRSSCSGSNGGLRASRTLVVKRTSLWCVCVGGYLSIMSSCPLSWFQLAFEEYV